MFKTKKSIRIITMLLIIVTLVTVNALAYSFTIPAKVGVDEGYKDVFTSITLDKADYVNISQTSSTNDRAVRYVLQRVNGGYFMDWEYLYGKQSTYLNSAYNDCASRLRAFNEYTTTTAASGSYSIT